MSLQTGDLGDYLHKTLESIDFSLSRKASRIPVVEEVINSTVLYGGKRVRPYLCLLFGNYLGVRSEKLEICARVIEMVHAASLAHDDVIDAAKFRRSRRTLNELTSNPQAVLGGDLLLASAVSDIVQCRSWDLVEDLGQVFEELVTGEWLQLEARGEVDIDRGHLEKVFYLKTGSLLSWCCLAPLRLGGFEGQLVVLAREFARLLGVAFQIVDDCIDYTTESGKDFAKDYKEGLLNDVSLRILEQNPELRSRFKSSLGNADVPWPWTPEQLTWSLGESRRLASSKLDLARICLDKIQVEAKLLGIDVNPQAAEALEKLMQQIEKRNA